MTSPANNLALEVAAAIKSRRQPTVVCLLEEVADFCMNEANFSVIGDWGREVVVQLVGYHMAKDTLTVIRDKDSGEVSGVNMWYLCNSTDGKDFLLNWEPDTPNGDTILLAFTFASNTSAFKQIALELIRKEPDVLTKKLKSLRTKGGEDGVLVDYDLRLFNKILKLKD
jgi:hypothetical protein